MKKEIWKDIKGYEGLYKISNYGNVFSVKRNKLLKTTIHHYGYVVISLNKNNAGRMFSVHRLVAEAFIPNPDNLPQVNHIDEDKTNNTVANLEWCTAGYNTNYGTRNKKVSEKMTNGKLSKPIYQFSLDGVLIKEWPSAMEIQRKTDYKQAAISDCCNGKCKTMYGYKWSYK